MAELSPKPVPAQPAEGKINWHDVAGHRIYSKYPRLWFLCALASGCLLLELAQLFSNSGDDKAVYMVLALFLRVTGSLYWMVCVYRFHKILREFSGRKYPVAPVWAVALQLVPLFCYYWFFHWTRTMAGFVNQRAAVRMRRNLSGWILVVASLCGLTAYGPLSLLGSVRLFLLFGVGLYIKRMLRSALPEPQPYRARRLAHLNASMSAGVGAAFTFVLVQGVRDIGHETVIEQLHEFIAIVAVSVGVLIFFEPMFERLRIVLAKEQGHAAPGHRPWLIRLTLFATLVIASMLHGVLHTEIETGIKKNPEDMIGTLIVALLISGGITYAWIGASHQHKPHATRSGALSGAILGALLIFAVGTKLYAEPSPQMPQNGKAEVTAGIVFACPWIPRQAVDDLRSGNFQDRYILEIVTIWTLLGLAGGFAIDRGSPSRRTYRVALAIFLTAIPCAIAIHFLDRVSPGEIASHLSAVAGWGLALIACPSSSILNATETGVS
jgi:hypothetical protein